MILRDISVSERGINLGLLHAVAEHNLAASTRGHIRLLRIIVRLRRQQRTFCAGGICDSRQNNIRMKGSIFPHSLAIPAY